MIPSIVRATSRLKLISKFTFQRTVNSAAKQSIIRRLLDTFQGALGTSNHANSSVLDKNSVLSQYLDFANNEPATMRKSRRLIEAEEAATIKTKLEEENGGLSTLDNEIGAESSLDELREAYAEALKEESNIWLDHNENSCYVYLYRGGGKPSCSLAAFDLDGTLIKPKSNKRIPRSATDWDFFSVWTKMKLQQAIRENQARFVIFTNQNGVGLNVVPLEEVQKRIELVTHKLDIPCTVFMAVEKDVFRKPRTGMFQLFNRSFNDTIPVDYETSFYCGDAVGYPSHSDADILFAKKLGLPFLAPDKFVRGVKPKLLPRDK